MSNDTFEKNRFFTNLNSILETLILVESENKTEEKIEEENQIKKEITHINNFISHAQEGIRQFYNSNPELRERWYEYIIKRLNTIEELLEKHKPSYYEERKHWLFVIRNYINELFSSKENTTPVSKLHFNAPANVIYNLFQQLMNEESSIQKGQPVITQNATQVAHFLKSCIGNFENTSIETIVKELTRKDLIIKKDKLIVKVSK